jgi:hypothetical protein
VCHNHQHQSQHQEHHPMEQELCIHNRRYITLRNQELGEEKGHQAQTKGSRRKHTFLSGHHNGPWRVSRHSEIQNPVVVGRDGLHPEPTLGHLLPLRCRALARPHCGIPTNTERATQRN